MRKFLLLSAALLAVMAGPALAQRGERGGSRGAPPAASRQAAPPAAPRTVPGSRADIGRQGMQREQAQRQQFQQAQRNNNDRRGDFNRGGDNRPDFNRGGNNRPDFNRGNDRRDFGRNDGRFDNRRFDNRPGTRNGNWARYNRNFNASRRFQYRGGYYRRPAGWYYRRWSFGDFLPSLFWASNYWINDYFYYDLMPPPPGTVWVRYGDDALLIDRYSGEIIQVEYGIFF